MLRRLETSDDMKVGGDLLAQIFLASKSLIVAFYCLSKVFFVTELNSLFLDGSGKLSDSSPAGSVGSASEAYNELAGLSLEEQEQQRAEWSQELARVEEEIQTLRTVLASKIHHSTELKRKLGITVWKEITDDVSSGIKNVKESNV